MVKGDSRTRGPSPRGAKIQWGGQEPNSSPCFPHCPDRAERGLASAGINSWCLGSSKSFPSSKESSSAPVNPEQARFNLFKIENTLPRDEIPPETSVTVFWMSFFLGMAVMGCQILLLLAWTWLCQRNLGWVSAPSEAWGKNKGRKEGWCFSSSDSKL